MNTSAQTPQLTAEAELVKAIREAGRELVQRDTFYQLITVADLPALAGPAKPEGLSPEEIAALARRSL